MNAQHCRPLESILSRLLKTLVSGWGQPAAAALRSEFGVASVNATMSAMRARAFFKFPDVKTWIATLFASPFTHRRATWISAGSRWTKRHRLDFDALPDLKNTLDAQTLASDRSVGSTSYIKNGYNRTNDFIRHYINHVAPSTFLDSGIAGLIAARTGLFTAHMAELTGFDSNGG